MFLNEEKNHFPSIINSDQQYVYTKMPSQHNNVTWSSDMTENAEIMFSIKITRERLFLIALIATTLSAVLSTLKKDRTNNMQIIVGHQSYLKTKKER